MGNVLDCFVQEQQRQPLITGTSSVIFVLELENNKYYVEKTNDVSKRCSEHVNGKGTRWTKLYKPISISATFLSTSSFNVENCTKQYMVKYGIDNVRGGSYSSLTLSNEQKELLEEEIKGLKRNKI